MIFASPHWLWALLALPLLAAAEAWALRRDRARTAALVARPLWPRVLRRPDERWRLARLALLLVGAAGLVLALARPQWGIVREKIEREGADVVLVLDTSGSMAVEDVAPNRFFLAKAALQNLVARLPGERFALVAFEGEAYPLVPLTLDADALGLFLETLEPGAVSMPGTSLGTGLERGLALFVDPERRHKVMVLVSDGENLEGDVEAVVLRAKEAGVVIHTVGIGTERGQPVPDFDREGRPVGYKKDESGAVVVSRLDTATLEAAAQRTGGRFFRITPADTSLSALAAAIEGLEQRSLAREFSYRKKERFQVPLGFGLAALGLALLLPPPRWRRTAAAALLLASLGAPAAGAQETGGVVDELLLRPRRLTSQGRGDWERGDHPGALRAFEQAAKARPRDPRAQFNLADGLYKNGKFDEAAAIWRALGQDARSPLAAPSRFNLGNSLYSKQDFPGAIQAYRDALQVAPGDEATRRNLELALRALQQQQQQQENNKDKKQDQQQQQQQQQPGQQQQPRPKSQQEQEQERFQKETGMPKERAMQLLDALQQNEKAEQQKRQRAQARKRTGRDW
jgi:Ca-activated chloride channel family protein